MELFSKEVYSQRRESLRAKMNKGVVLFFGNDEAPMSYASNCYHFRQDSSFLYFFGLDIPGLTGIIDLDENKHIIFGNDVDIDDIIWMGPQPSMKNLGEKVDVTDTRPFAQLFDYVGKAIAAGREIHFLPPYRYENKIKINQLLNIPFEEQKSKASVEFIKAVVALREVKDSSEIIELKEAAKIGYEMHYTAMKMAKNGILEQEIFGTMEGISFKHGSGPSFPTILSVRGETLHNHIHNNIMKDGQMLLVDAGAESNMHYASDYTRTMPVSGKFTQKQKEIYQIVLDANNHAFQMVKPGVTYQSVHMSMSEVIAQGLIDLGLMKGNAKEAVAAGAHALFLPHGLGHAMGLDVHDMEDLGENYVGYDNETKRSEQFGTSALRLGKKLKKGFVMTDEPGIYFIPELIDQWQATHKFENFIDYNKVNTYRTFGGIRLEDDIIVTDNGGEYVGKRLPITIEEVEETMKNN